MTAPRTSVLQRSKPRRLFALLATVPGADTHPKGPDPAFACFLAE